MASDLNEVCESIWQLRDPEDHAGLARLAADAARLGGDRPDVVANVVESVFAATAEAGTASESALLQRVTMWSLLDKLSKESPAYVAAFRPRLVDLGIRYFMHRSAPHGGFFWQLLDGLAFTYGGPLAAMVKIKAKAAADAAAPPAATAAEGGAAGAAADAAAPSGQLTTVGTGTGGSHALVARSGRAVGGFVAQRANNARPAGAEHALQVKTRDSLQAMRMASAYVPAMPEEMQLPAAARDADAADGFMQALPEGYVENYLDARKKRLRDIAANRRSAEEARRKAAAERRTRGEEGEAVDSFDDVVMPLELPRDEHGVKIANFPAGVRFLRDAIRQCGGALELTLLEERMSQLADAELKAEFGDLRRFIFIHKPTFAVVEERNRWVVRLVGDEPPDLTMQYFSWENTECALCSKIVPGRNLAKHLNNRKCVGIQLANGLSGRTDRPSPICTLGLAAKAVMDRRDHLDDDDVMHFARCLDDAAGVARFKFASDKQFAPILKAVRVVRDDFLRAKGVTEIANAKVTGDDRAVCALFAALGTNLKRLPVREQLRQRLVQGPQGSARCLHAYLSDSYSNRSPLSTSHCATADVAAWSGMPHS